METKNYRGCVGSVEYSEEDACFFGTLLHTTDLISYEAESPSTLQRTFKGAVDDYFKTC